MSGGRSGRDLNATPTWAVALVSAVIVLISIILEKLLHGIGKKSVRNPTDYFLSPDIVSSVIHFCWDICMTFERKRKKALVDALEKIKGELMVLGFISLLLTFGQNYIARICIPVDVANTMLPCPLPPALEHNSNYPPVVEGDHPPPVAEGDHPPPEAEEAEGDHPPPVAEGDHPTPVAEGDHPTPVAKDESNHLMAEGDHPPPVGEGEHPPPLVESKHPNLAAEGDRPLPVLEGKHPHHPHHRHHPHHPHPVAEGDHPPPVVEGDHPPLVTEGEHHRRLLWNEHRFLSSETHATVCKKGHIPLISISALHQLHIFIFFLAVFHVIFGAITMSLGRLKIRGWKEWERESFLDNDQSNDSSRFRLTHETSFVRGNTSFLTKAPIMFYPVCFYRQFFRSVRKPDYLTMRHGFISVHLAPGSKFDFQKYIKRSLEDDFKVVVGISPVLWASAVIYLLLNVHGWQIMLWLSMLPLVTILAIGTKLQAIITQMAVEIQERHAVVQGIPLVSVSDRHFWFSRPHFILHLIHFTLFQNAFEITYFIWITYEFGLHSCFNEDLKVSVVRVAIGLVVQVVCSYITLPLYSLVTQMGSNIKKSVFDDQTNKALSKWTMTAKKKRPIKIGRSETRKMGGGSPGRSRDNSPRSSFEMSTVKSGTDGQAAAANITASVDIPGENHPPPTANNNASHPHPHNPDFPDLLTGP